MDTAVSHEQFGHPTIGTIPTIIRSFKSAVTKRINAIRHTPGERVWQRNYYEHVIRDERALWAIRNYIRENPRNWRQAGNADDRWVSLEIVR